jgi:hypothetical protein
VTGNSLPLVALADFVATRIDEDEHSVVMRSLAHDWPSPFTDPKRGIAEVEAKRRLIRLFDEHPEGIRVRQLLALSYADHPDYDEAWRI